MLRRSSMGAVVLAAALMVPVGQGLLADEARYPNWRGQWFTVNPSFGGQIIKFDPAKPWGPGQQAPLTPEYQKVLEDSMADQARGGLGTIRAHVVSPEGCLE